MFSTPITRTFGLTTPIVNAGMAMIALPLSPPRCAKLAGSARSGPISIRPTSYATSSDKRRR